MATPVNEYAASEMRYWCRTGDYGGVGYSQPNRWSAYDHSDWAGWLKGPGEMDCSAGVAGAYNIAFHECGAGHTLFPRSTWTGSLPGESARRGFTDIGGTWTGSVPDGGFRPGDLLMADDHVAMAVRDQVYTGEVERHYIAMRRRKRAAEYPGTRVGEMSLDHVNKV